MVTRYQRAQLLTIGRISYLRANFISGRRKKCLKIGGVMQGVAWQEHKKLLFFNSLFAICRPRPFLCCQSLLFELLSPCWPQPPKETGSLDISLRPVTNQLASALIDYYNNGEKILFPSFGQDAGTSCPSAKSDVPTIRRSGIPFPHGRCDFRTAERVFRRV